MRMLPSLRYAGPALLMLLCLPACILVVDEDALDDDRLHRYRWRLDVVVYAGRSYVADEPFTLSFETDGELYGRADCLDYDGTYISRGLGALSVRNLYSDGGTCGRNSIEDLYLDVLSDAVSYRIRGDELTLSARGGDALYFYRD